MFGRGYGDASCVVHARLLVVLAVHRRHFVHGPGVDCRRFAARLRVDEWHRVGRHRGADEGLLAGAYSLWHQHGHWDVSPRHQSDDDSADQAGGGDGTDSGTGPDPASRRRAGSMNARFVALVAGVFFFFLAVATQGILPFVEPSARTNRVTAVVRTDLR